MKNLSNKKNEQFIKDKSYACKTIDKEIETLKILKDDLNLFLMQYGELDRLFYNILQKMVLLGSQ